MKQHITLEQLGELNEEQRKKLDGYGDGVTGLLTIGDMIEFLWDKTGSVEYKCEEGKVMCDELWKAVKETLN